MTEQKNADVATDNDFLATRLNFGIVIYGTLHQIEQLKQFIQDNNIKVRYQRVSGNFLKISEGQ